MKFIPVVLSLFLCSIIYLQPPLLYSADAADLPEAVLDVNGDKLQPGVAYHIVSAIRGAGGGGVAQGSPNGLPICPRAVVQLPLDVLRGDPLVLLPADTNEDVVRLSSDVNIKFLTRTFCNPPSTVWTVQQNEAPMDDFIVTGGEEGNPGADTINNWFKIEKAGFVNAYKISFCPSVCESCPVTRCKDVGINFDYGRALSLTDKEEPSFFRPFQVVFEKASSI